VGHLLPKRPERFAEKRSRFSQVHKNKLVQNKVRRTMFGREACLNYLTELSCE
jgi:hypothetical protein